MVVSPAGWDARYRGEVRHSPKVESYHTPKGPRQRVVVFLGDLSPRPRAAWRALFRQVEEALDPQGRLGEELLSAEARQVAARGRIGFPPARRFPPRRV